MSEKFSQMVYAYAYNGTIVTEVEQEDPYNSVRVRNADNVNQFAFNCGGYALETFNWFLPIMNESSIAENAEEKWLISNGFIGLFKKWTLLIRTSLMIMSRQK